jgi:hypothetical protein
MGNGAIGLIEIGESGAWKGQIAAFLKSAISLSLPVPTIVVHVSTIDRCHELREYLCYESARLNGDQPTGPRFNVTVYGLASGQSCDWSCGGTAFVGRSEPPSEALLDLDIGLRMAGAANVDRYLLAKGCWPLGT